MERSGIGLSAGRRPLQEPETGLVGARPQLDNGGGRRQKKWSMLSERICYNQILKK